GPDDRRRSSKVVDQLCRVLFGPLTEPPHTPDTSTGLTTDLTGREIAILAPLALACVLIGVYPKPLLESFETAARQHVLLEPASLSITDSAMSRETGHSLPVISSTTGFVERDGPASTDRASRSITKSPNRPITQSIGGAAP
ncbi:MAG: hypothetical protein Q7R41_04490, partial [Phycisphaerales bacterium]|nr:hypothetical protein [Phycisphaerales bacterium]